jgi:hypothetical protein
VGDLDLPNEAMQPKLPIQVMIAELPHRAVEADVANLVTEVHLPNQAMDADLDGQAMEANLANPALELHLPTQATGAELPTQAVEANVANPAMEAHLPNQAIYANLDDTARTTAPTTLVAASDGEAAAATDVNGSSVTSESVSVGPHLPILSCTMLFTVYIMLVVIQ